MPPLWKSSSSIIWPLLASMPAFFNEELAASEARYVPSFATTIAGNDPINFCFAQPSRAFRGAYPRAGLPWRIEISGEHPGLSVLFARVHVSIFGVPDLSFPWAMEPASAWARNVYLSAGVPRPPDRAGHSRPLRKNRLVRCPEPPVREDSEFTCPWPLLRRSSPNRGSRAKCGLDTAPFSKQAAFAGGMRHTRAKQSPATPSAKIPP